MSSGIRGINYSNDLTYYKLKQALKEKGLSSKYIDAKAWKLIPPAVGGCALWGITISVITLVLTFAIIQRFHAVSLPLYGRCFLITGTLVGLTVGLAVGCSTWNREMSKIVTKWKFDKIIEELKAKSNSTER